MYIFSYVLKVIDGVLTGLIGEAIGVDLANLDDEVVLKRIRFSARRWVPSSVAPGELQLRHRRADAPARANRPSHEQAGGVAEVGVVAARGQRVVGGH